MNLPFTIDQFLDLFSKYNNSIWPLQIFMNIAALYMVFLAVKQRRNSGRIILASLSLFWLWMAVGYHLRFFTSINPAAYGFAALFILQSAVLGWLSFRNRLVFQFEMNNRGFAGIIIMAYAVIIYPLLGIFIGHSYPYSPTFGLPCPTTMFTFGILLWTRNLPRYSIIIPAIWSVIGFSAALLLGMYEDIGLLICAIIATPFILARKRPVTADLN